MARAIDPSKERFDGYQFKVGEVVKFWNRDNNLQYGIILEDNRPLEHCTYGYTVAPLPRDREYSDGGYTVYGMEPFQLVICNNVEKVLYG